MSRTINLLLLALIFCVGLLSCGKEYSVEEGGFLGGGGTTTGTAKFTLNGAPGDCSPVTMSGTYKAGVALDQSNTILIIANVTVIGDYTISTAQINGVTFSGAGVFTTVGTQVITLIGSGTPTDAGNFNYSVGSAYCSFTVPFVAGTGGGTGTAAYTLNGGTGNCVSPVIGGTYTAGTALTATNTIRIGVNVTTAGTYSLSTNSANGVTFTGAGTFTTTGPATITLTSLNTPTAAGTFAYKPGTNGCTFSITYVSGTGGGTGSGSALFTFNGGTGNCASPAIGGTFTAGVPLTSANTVVLAVNVTTPGTYSLTTSSANGVTFSGAGSFTAAGPATISLTSTNTGLTEGTFTYTPPNGCIFSIVYQPAATTNGDFLKATLAGVAYQFNNNLTGSVSNGAQSSLDVDGDLSSPGSGADHMLISFYNMSGAITSGTYNPISATNITRFTLLSYFDNSGAEWLLTSGTVTLTLTGTTSATATFSGTLSKVDSNQQPTGVTKVLSAGSFKITF
jgi:hypothetical protein